MGRTANEISGRREAGGHRARRAIPSAGSAVVGADRNPKIHVLSMVRSLSDWRAREALDDCSPRPDRVWNRIPDDVRARIVTLALDEPTSPAFIVMKGPTSSRTRRRRRTSFGRP